MGTYHYMKWLSELLIFNKKRRRKLWNESKCIYTYRKVVIRVKKRKKPEKGELDISLPFSVLKITGWGHFWFNRLLSNLHAKTLIIGATWFHTYRTRSGKNTPGKFSFIHSSGEDLLGKIMCDEAVFEAALNLWCFWAFQEVCCCNAWRKIHMAAVGQNAHEHRV